MATAVIYASKFGNTKKTAEYIANKIGGEAIEVSDDLDISKYDKIILGTGIYAGKPAKSMTSFVNKNKGKLSGSSLFVSCMYNDDKGAKQLEKIASEMGIADAIFFNKPKKQIGVADSKLETYIKSLM